MCAKGVVTPFPLDSDNRVYFVYFILSTLSLLSTYNSVQDCMSSLHLYLFCLGIYLFFSLYIFYSEIYTEKVSSFLHTLPSSNHLEQRMSGIDTTYDSY